MARISASKRSASSATATTFSSGKSFYASSSIRIERSAEMLHALWGAKAHSIVFFCAGATWADEQRDRLPDHDHGHDRLALRVNLTPAASLPTNDVAPFVSCRAQGLIRFCSPTPWFSAVGPTPTPVRAWTRPLFTTCRSPFP